MRRLATITALAALAAPWGCSEGEDEKGDAGLFPGAPGWPGGPVAPTPDESATPGMPGGHADPGVPSEESDPADPSEENDIGDPAGAPSIIDAGGLEEIDSPDAAPPPIELPPEPEDPNAPCTEEGLDYLGRCSGNVAEWCDDGRFKTEDCGGQGCGWTGGDNGMYCGGSGARPDGRFDGDGPADPGPEDPGPNDGGGCGEPEENRVIELVNEARGGSGLGSLTCDDAATRAARGHSRDMCEQGYFDHTGLDGSSPGDRMRREGAQFGGWGENIAWGQSSAEEVHSTWMNSPGHRSNIMGSDYRRIGVGLHDCGGQKYWTQAFMD